MSISKKMKFRILKLCDFMERLPRAATRHFYMGSFLIDESEGHNHAPPETPSDLLHSCKTTACALGWAATMPYFRKRGCRFQKNGVLKGVSVVVPIGGKKWGPLFGGWNFDRTPKQWAKRARRLVREWEAK